ncbi:unnamed protein product [Fusarium venenatum]|uniref:Uncharacterized protein n=1 Tax=Fusarium venenatum TaxID=56646 RepID=A0A2L2SRS4_9HYPO|nr:LOW QUALITY PROTEIN: uncharacterized protein FVRRES_12601 [Fusarium venenatum]CEI39910.1 unnamed protein product [Fusarium venenatum]
MPYVLGYQLPNAFILKKATQQGTPNHFITATSFGASFTQFCGCQALQIFHKVIEFSPLRPTKFDKSSSKFGPGNRWKQSSQPLLLLLVSILILSQLKPTRRGTSPYGIIMANIAWQAMGYLLGGLAKVLAWDFALSPFDTSRRRTYLQRLARTGSCDSQPSQASDGDIFNKLSRLPPKTTQEVIRLCLTNIMICHGTYLLGCPPSEPYCDYYQRIRRPAEETNLWWETITFNADYQDIKVVSDASENTTPKGSTKRSSSLLLTGRYQITRFISHGIKACKNLLAEVYETPHLSESYIAQQRCQRVANG